MMPSQGNTPRNEVAQMAYTIKGTYPESGRSFFLDRDGYVLDSLKYIRPCNCYETARAAKMVATKKNKANAEQVAYDKARNERRAAKGLPLFLETNVCIYEAYEVKF